MYFVGVVLTFSEIAKRDLIDQTVSFTWLVLLIKRRFIQGSLKYAVNSQLFKYCGRFQVYNGGIAVFKEDIDIW